MRANGAIYSLHLRITGLDDVILIWGVRSAAVPETEVTGRKMQWLSSENVSGPRTCKTGKHDRIDAGALVHRLGCANDSRIRRRAGGIVPAGHVDLDIAKTMAGQMRFQLCQ